MNHKYFSKIASFAMIFTVHLIAVGNVFACICPYLTICQTYTYAEAVFVGKVEKIADVPGKVGDRMNITFTVAKTYKGDLGKTEVIEFLNPKDCGTSFKVGETYFVYKDESPRPCNETRPLRNANEHVKYAESLSAENPVFFIKGRIENSEREALTADELKNTRITIEKGRAKYNVEADKSGKFEFKTAEKGTFRVKITLPFEAEVSANPFMASQRNPDDISTTETQTSVSYEVEFSPNSCVYLALYVTKTKKAGKAAFLDLIQKDLIINSLYENRRIRAVLRPV